MRVLGSAVLVMEFFVMGFAMLLAKDNQEPSSIIAGAVIAILMLLTRTSQEAHRVDSWIYSATSDDWLCRRRAFHGHRGADFRRTLDCSHCGGAQG